jgi:hypothetical protein
LGGSVKKERNYRNEDWLRNQYRTLNKSIHQIGKEENVDGQTILNWMNKFNIPIRTRTEWWKLDSYRNKIEYSDSKKIWNKEEIGVLKELYLRTDIGIDDISIMMNRTSASVKWKAREIGLFRPPEYKTGKSTENLMYFWKEIFPNYTEEEKKEWNENRIHPGLSGSDNPMWGKSPYDFMTPERAEKVREKFRGKNNPMWGKRRPDMEGVNNPNWKGGVSFLPYPLEFNKRLKKYIRERDNYICQLCEEFGDNVHHINGIKGDCRKVNLITLCFACHRLSEYNTPAKYAIRFRAFTELKEGIKSPLKLLHIRGNEFPIEI